MSEQTAQKQRYMVSAYELEEASGALIFTFVPKGLPQERGLGAAPGRLNQACRQWRDRWELSSTYCVGPGNDRFIGQRRIVCLGGEVE